MPLAAVRFLPSYAAADDQAALRNFITYGWRVTVLGSSAAAVLFVAVEYLLSVLQQRTVGVIAGAPLILLFCLTSLTTGMLQSIGMPLRGEAVANVIRPALIALLVGFAAATLGRQEAPSALALTCVAAAVALALTLAPLRRAFTASGLLQYDRDAQRQWIASGLGFMASLGLMSIIERLDTILLGMLSGVEQAGVYSVATRLAVLVGFALAAVNARLSPMAAELLGRKDRTDLQVLLANGALLASGLSLGLALAIVAARPVLLGMFGPAFGAAAPVLVILAAAQWAQATLGSAGGLLGFDGRNRLVIAIMLAAVLLDVGLCLLLIPPFGTLGAALATATATVGCALGLAIAARRLLHVDTTLCAGVALLRRSRGPDMGAPRRAAMERWRFRWPLLLLAMLPLDAAAQPWPANGDFSQGGLPPAGWSLDPEVRMKGELRIGAAAPGMSGHALELAPGRRNTPSTKPFGIGQFLSAAPLRGRRVGVSAVLSATGGAGAVLGLVVLGRNGPAASLLLRDTGEEPMSQQGQLAVPDEDILTSAVLFLVAEGTEGVARFAAIDVRPLAEAPAVAPPASQAIDLPASVEVDTSRVLRQIPAALFGTNVEVIRDANGLWDAPAQRLEPTLLGLARDLGVTSVRFPGGVWSDCYDWRDGVGPFAQRQARPTHPGAEESVRNLFGTDELLSFVREIGASGLITVNAGTGSPELAAAWVRYVNGTGGRTPRGGRVDLWEIGNELYIDGDMSGAHMSPERYADRVVAFATAMRAVDPGIRIAATGLHNAGRYRFSERDDWDAVVLRRAGAAIDFLAVHDAYAPVVGDGTGIEPAAVYAAMLAAPRMIARNLQETWREVERNAPTEADRIRLAVTEWGPLFAVTPSSPWIDHVKTLGSAVFVAATLKVFAEEPHLALANFFKLNEASFMGWIGRRGTAWVPNAPFLAFQMVARDFESGLLRTTVAVARYDSPAIGVVDAQAGVPYLDALATRSSDGKTVTVLLINKHLGAGVTVRLTLAGSRGAARLETVTLSGDAPDADTGTQLPDIPGLHWADKQLVTVPGRPGRAAAGAVRSERAILAAPGSTVTVHVPPHAITRLRFEEVLR